MAPHFHEGTHSITIVNQGFDDGDYGVQFLLTVDVDNTGKERTVYLALTDEHGQRAKYADKTIEVLRHLGFAGSEASLTRLDTEHSNHFSLVGVHCEGYCSHKTKGDGTVGERWYINTPRAGMERTPPAKTALRKLDSLFGKELKEPLPEGTAPPSLPRTSEAMDQAVQRTEPQGDINPDGPGDGDIPF
jgi:hypothetical protein